MPSGGPPTGRRRASGRPRHPYNSVYQPAVGPRSNSRLPNRHRQVAQAIATQVQMEAMVSIEEAPSTITSSLLRMALMAPSKLRNSMRNDSTFPVIWDSGASISVSPNRDEFVGEYTKLPFYTQLLGLAKGARVEGQGQVQWAFHDTQGTLRVITVPAYHVPQARTHLLATSSLLQQYKGEHITSLPYALELSGIPGDLTRGSIIAPVNPKNNIPTSTGYRPDDTMMADEALSSIISVVSEENLNLSAAEKELVRWHQRLGHISFRTVQFLMRTGVLSHTAETRQLHTAAAKIVTPPKCAACQYGKQTVRPSPGKTSSVVQDRQGALSQGDLLPGQQISVDHFICSTRGRLFTGQGKGEDKEKYHGGAIFVDHSTGYIQVEFQVSLNTHEMLAAKEKFELKCRDHGITPQAYLMDNGSSFTSADFTKKLSSFHQISRFAGSGAHHHNGIAERSIRTSCPSQEP